MSVWDVHLTTEDLKFFENRRRAFKMHILETEGGAREGGGYLKNTELAAGWEGVPSMMCQG